MYEYFGKVYEYFGKVCVCPLGKIYVGASGEFVEWVRYLLCELSDFKTQ